MTDSVKINIADVNSKLAQMATIDDAQMETAVRAGLLPIEVMAKAIVARVTGTLARSIHIEAQSSGAGVTGRVGTNVEYARVQELRPGKAYLRPAFDGAKDEAIAEVSESLKIIIREAAA